MEIRNLVAFLQVASTKNFTQSAQILGYSQSNISMQIQSLENELGVSLFDRVGHNISLTQYGEELIPYAQQVVSLVMQIQDFQRSDKEMGGTLKIGIVESLFEAIFEETIRRYHARFPKVKIELTVDGTSELQDALKNGKIDIAYLIDDALNKSYWNCLYSHSVEIAIVANSNNSITKKNQLSIKDISNQEFILVEESAPYNSSFQHCAALNNIEIDLFLQLQSTKMARKLVSSGSYISVLPIYTVKKSIEDGDIKILNIPEFSLKQQVQIVVYKNKILTPQMNGFIEESKYILDSIL